MQHLRRMYAPLHLSMSVRMGVLIWTRLRSMLTDGLVYFVALTGTHPVRSPPVPALAPLPYTLTPVPVDRREHLQPDPLPPAERSDTGTSAPTLCHNAHTHRMVADPSVCPSPPYLRGQSSGCVCLFLSRRARE